MITEGAGRGLEMASVTAAVAIGARCGLDATSATAATAEALPVAIKAMAPTLQGTASMSSATIVSALWKLPQTWAVNSAGSFVMLQRHGMPGLQTREVDTPLFACHSSCFSAWRDCTHTHASCASVTLPALLHPRLTISADTQQQSKTVTVSAGQIGYFCSSLGSTPSLPLSALCRSLHLVI